MNKPDYVVFAKITGFYYLDSYWQNMLKILRQNNIPYELKRHDLRVEFTLFLLPSDADKLSELLLIDDL